MFNIDEFNDHIIATYNHNNNSLRMQPEATCHLQNGKKKMLVIFVYSISCSESPQHHQ